MFIDFVKFIHLTATLGLLGTAIYCLFLIFSHTLKHKLSKLNKVMLMLAGIAILTGSLLVHPKHFTFHTAWIEAAYVLMIIVGVIMTLLIFANKKYSILTNNRLLSVLVYLFLIVIFLIVIHDAVTKTTLL